MADTFESARTRIQKQTSSPEGGELLACPFCRELSPAPGAPGSGLAERAECPHCGLALAPLESLRIGDDDDEIPPEHQRLPLTYWRRQRGAIALIALLGLGTFFAPWAHVTAPEIHDLDGFRLARELHTPWAAFAAFFVLLPVALSRRTIMKMRGGRVAVGFLGLVPLMTTVMRVATTPTSGRYLPIRIEWGWGLWACGALGLLAVVLAPCFGGTVAERGPSPPAGPPPP